MLWSIFFLTPIEILYSLPSKKRVLINGAIRLTQVNTTSCGLYPSLSAPNALPFHRANRDSLLNQAKEQFPAGSRCPSVKSKREFIQIIITL